MRRYETYLKVNGRYKFVGWYRFIEDIEMNEKFCINTRNKGNFIYKTYKWLNGNIDEYRYGSYVDEIN